MLKHIILIFCLLSTSVTWATKARLQSLAGSGHLLDVQTMYGNPLDLLSLENFISIETGVTAATSTTDNAEAVISATINENTKMAFSVGRQDEVVASSRLFMNTLTGSTYELPQNPVYLFFGQQSESFSYAFSLFYSNKKDKLNNLGESSAGLGFGAQSGNFQYVLNYVAANTAELAGGKKFDGNGFLKNAVSYQMDETKFELSYAISKAKQTTTVLSTIENESHSSEVISLGLVNSHVVDENDLFWGAQIVSTQIKCEITGSARCDKKFNSTYLPAWFGVEAQASKWLTFRSAIKQNILISQFKDEVPYPAGISDGTNGALSNTTAGSNSTSVTMGVGLKFNKLIIDGTLATASTQTLNFTNLMSQVGVTYNY